jgi:hypothetical protein
VSKMDSLCRYDAVGANPIVIYALECCPASLH